MENYHTKNDDEINERLVGTSGGQPLKMRRLTNVSPDGGYSTEHITEGFEDDEHRMNRVHDFDPTGSNVTREDSFREIVLEDVNKPFTSALYFKLNEDGTIYAVDCITSPNDARAIVRGIAAMIGKYYKAVAFDSDAGDYDYEKMAENSYQLMQKFSDGLDQFYTDEEKAGLTEAIKNILKNGKRKNNNT